MLKTLRENVSSWNIPNIDESGIFPNQAAVLIALTDRASGPEVLLTKRAEHLSSHSGEVSFPGGKWDDNDETLLQTALRESEEEIGLEPSVVEVLAPLQSGITRWGIKVTPFVGIVPDQVTLTPNPGELDAVFRVPISFFLADQRIRTDLYRRSEGMFWAPAYDFEGFEIWGFTARILVDFLNRGFDAGINQENSAPVKIYG
jgi:8-oxo-dGTP pyrophosphatase MutT (NUDIX family)